MRIIHTADWHITEGPRLDDQARTLDSIVDQVERQRADLLLIVGDLYGRTVPHRSTPAERNVVAAALARAADQCPIIIVAGNHDAPGDAELLSMLSTAHPITVASAADGIRPIPMDGATIWAVPYPRRTAVARWLERQGRDVDHGTVIAAGSALLDQALLHLAGGIRDMPGHHIIAAHVAVAGARVAGGERLAGREVECSTAALRALRDAGADYIALGHIHLSQQPAARAWYAGSPHRVDHGEIEAQKTIQSVRVLPGMLDVDQISVWSRRFLTVDAHWSDGEWSWSCSDVDGIDGAEVRLRMHIPEADRGLADRVHIETIIEEHGAVRIVSEVHISRDARVRSAEIAAASTDEERIRAYWATLSEPPSEDDQRVVMSMLAALSIGEPIGGEDELRRLIDDDRGVAA